MNTDAQDQADKETIDAYWAGRIEQLRRERDTFAYKPARDLRAGDVMWDPSGAYRISQVRRVAGIVHFDVDADGYHAEDWQLGVDEQVRVYV